jgi:hypothetical protein
MSSKHTSKTTKKTGERRLQSACPPNTHKKKQKKPAIDGFNGHTVQALEVWELADHRLAIKAHALVRGLGFRV